RTDSIVETDADKGYVWITGSGREQDQNPTFTHLYKAKIDGSDVTLLDEGDADHTSVVSPSKKFEIDNCSRVDMAPKSCLRDDRGKVILELEQEDLT
ncbi:DPP IV N-terminal domain-containing protein, partial [Acinetobacter baumannii]